MESEQNTSLGERAVKRIRKISLIWKTALAITAILALLTTVLVYCCLRIYRTRITDTYVAYGRSIAKTAASMIDCDRLDIYNAPTQIDSEYRAMIATLDKIRIQNDVSSIYAIRFNAAKDSIIYIMDSCDTDPYPLGLTEPLDEVSYNLPNQLDGEIPPMIFRDKEGWLCTVLTQCYTSNGDISALMGVAIPLDSIEKDCLSFYHKCLLVAAIVSVLMVLIAIYLMNRMIVSHIDKLAQAASCNISDKALTDVQSMISQLDIHTGDEIETLAESLKKMERDTNAYIRELTEATTEKERISTELNVANRIQCAMLPNSFPAFPQISAFDIFATMTPAKEVGGDFYDFFLTDDDHLAVIMADVSGKGMPAALFMVISKILIRNHALNDTSPAEVFNKVNTQLCENNRADMFVTAWLGVLELSTGKLTFVNAGHTPPMLCHKGGRFKYQKAPAGFVLGGLDTMRFQQQEVTLESGDTLLLYTDGITEATNAKSELFGEDRLEIVSNRNCDASPQELIEAIKEDVDRFVGDAPQFDDLTMLAVTYLGAENKLPVETVSNTFSADEDALSQMLDFLTEELEKLGCPSKMQPAILISAEEIFVNIASYAYPNGNGDVTVSVSCTNTPSGISVTFADSGIPYDPLSQDEPDTSLDAEEREIGGLGIFLVRKRMDDVTYEYRDNQNLLTFTKYF